MGNDAETLKSAVREAYSAVAKGQGGCCGGNDVIGIAEVLGYRRDDAQAVPDGANLGLGCGAPLTFAQPRPGETVLDLGSGAGFDAFLARRAVGAEGQVIGVDMTPDMLAKARANAEKVGYTNVEFRQGEIEALPVEDASVDLVISNCVLNLVPDKARAFAEICRVLRPGGRMVVSDIVRIGDLPPEIQESLAAYAACGAGALPLAEYLGGLAEAGLERIEVLREVDARDLLVSAACANGLEKLTAGSLSSATIRAWKPA